MSIRLTDPRFITINVALFGFLGILYLAVTHKHATENKKSEVARLRGPAALLQELNTSLPSRRGVMAVTRIHKGSAESMADPDKVIAFVKNTLHFANKAVISVEIGSELENYPYYNSLKERLVSENLTDFAILLPVSPWGKFTTALNVALQYAVAESIHRIVYQSLEVAMDRDFVQDMMTIMDKDSHVLVVGPALKGHLFDEGPRRVLNGRTCPWNTFAIWSVEGLALTGFPAVADGLGGNFGGVEEVAAVSILQKLKPNFRAILVRRRSQDGADWDTRFEDRSREAWHEHKMRTKESRAALQLHLLGRAKEPGWVDHVELK